METTSTKQRKWSSPAIVVLLATLLGGGIRLAYVVWLPGQNGDLLHSDMGAYDRAGRAMAHGESITGGSGFNGYHPLSASTYYHVGYTWFVAAMYRLFGDAHARLALRIVQAMLSTATIPLVFGIGRKLFDNRAGAIAAFLTAAYLPLVYYGGLMLTETVFIFLQMVGVWVWLDAIERGSLVKAGIAGLVVGLACTVRTAFLPAIAAWAVFVLFGRSKWIFERRLLLASALAISALVPIAPVTIRNLQIHDRWILLSTNGPATFYTGHVTKVNSDTESRPDETDADNAARLQRMNFEFLRDHWRDYLMEMPEYYSGIWLSSDFWPAHTVIVAYLQIDDQKRKGRTKMIGDEPNGPAFARLDHFPDAIRYCDQILWLLLSLPTALLAPLFLPRQNRSWIVVYLTLIPYLIVPWIAPPFARYRIPACPLVFLLSGNTIATLATLIYSRKNA